MLAVSGVAPTSGSHIHCNVLLFALQTLSLCRTSHRFPHPLQRSVLWLKINEPDSAIGIGDIRAKVEEARKKPLPKNGEVGNGRSSDNVKATQGGNDTSYTLRRLARDCPEMLDRIEAGELSAKADPLSHAGEHMATKSRVDNITSTKGGNATDYTLRRRLPRLDDHKRHPGHINAAMR